MFVNLCPAVVKGIVGLHTGESLNPIEASQRIHLPPVNCHLVSPAPSGQGLHLDPPVQGAIVLPHLMLRLFTS